MADVITRFKLETTQYESKLRNASKDLAEYARTASLAGKEFDKFTKNNVAAAKAFGSIETSSTNAKDKVKELVGAYNDMARAYNSLTKEQQQSDWAKAMAESMQQLKTRISEAKKEMMGLSAPSGSGLLGGNSMSGMLQVFGGNMMTNAVSLVASGMEQLGEKIVDITQKSIEMSAQAEGIVNAFNRLDKPGLLENLREATHGTVNDLELMKAAVKFNDFNLPVEQLGTMLAFAQQKAKDTGQSVDYMVDSIVTGLGRKSLMILDNLGLSAAQIKERMAETGDMTTAVAEIIRERMSEAGDYVETAADRAAQANAELENSYLELGNQIRETFAFTGMSSVEELKVYMEKELVGSISFTVDWIDHLKDVLSSITDIYDDITAASPFPQMLEDIVALYTPLSAVAMLLSKIRGGDDSTIGDASGTGGVIVPKPKVEGSLSITKENGQIVKVMRDGVDITKEYIKSLDKASQSVATLKKRLSELEEQRAKAIREGDTELSKSIQKQINQTKADIRGLDPNALKTSTKKHGKTETEEQLNTKLIQQYSREFEKASAERREWLLQEIKVLQQRNAEIKYYQDLATGKTVRPMGADVMEGQGIGLGTVNSISQELSKPLDASAIKTPLQSLEEELNNLIELQKLAWSPKQFSEYQSMIENVQGKIGAFKGSSKEGEETGKSWKEAASAISSAGSSLQQLEDPSAKIVGIIGQAIANIALGFAQATASDSKLGVFGWIAAIAGGLATMTATVAAIHSATGYAQGGIIKGNSYSGDNIGGLVDGSQFVGLNAGEVVLNASQQRMVAQNLQDNGGGMHVVGEIQGEKIVLVANRFLSRSGQGELVTWK